MALKMFRLLLLLGAVGSRVVSINLNFAPVHNTPNCFRPLTSILIEKQKVEMFEIWYNLLEIMGFSIIGGLVEQGDKANVILNMFARNRVQ